MFVFATMYFLTLTFHLQAETFAKVQEVLKDEPDLAAAFRDFMPGMSSTPDSDSLGMLRGSSTRSWNPRRGRVGRI